MVCHKQKEKPTQAPGGSTTDKSLGYVLKRVMAVKFDKGKRNTFIE